MDRDQEKEAKIIEAQISKGKTVYHQRGNLFFKVKPKPNN